MTDDEHGSRRPSYQVIQTFPSIRVQMVGRFVQQDGCRVVQLHARQEDAGFFAAAKSFHRTGEWDTVQSPIVERSQGVFFHVPVIVERIEVLFGSVTA